MKWLQAFGFLFVDCRDASHLTQAEQGRQLGRSERLGLLLHRAICAPCRHYRRQLEVLRKLAARAGSGESNGAETMDLAARERIRQRLRAAGQQSSDPGH